MARLFEMEVFADVVARGSFSATARAKSLSPSGVSKLIHRLESKLGMLLFRHDGNRVALTSEGQRYHEGVLRVLTAMTELEAQNEAAAGADISGQLRILCSSSFATRIIIPLVTEFTELYPNVDIDFVIGSGAPLQSLDPAIDLAFNSADTASDSLLARRIVRSQHVICAAPAYLAKHGTPSSPVDLAEHRCVNFSIKAPFDRWPMQMQNGEILQLNIQPKIVADNSEILLSLACDGAGIGRFSTFETRAAINSGRLVLVLEDFNPRTDEAIYALHHKKRYICHRVRAFLDFAEGRLAKAETPAPSLMPKMRLVT
ncbi:MAG: LysR family transcriptional regulator [Alphaproteobacteria bacterium]|nr:LysR family transcriptional regulator [Alphaproteobacteria bacterium]